MGFKKLLCLDFTGSELEELYWRQLDELTEKRVLAQEDEISAHIGADALLVKLGAKIDSNFMNKFPNLKYIGMLGTGYGGIDTQTASAKGIAVTNIADYATEAVAEFTFGILLNHLRAIGVAAQQASEANYSDDFSGKEIKNKKFGVLGLGNIGMRTARLAQSFGAEVIYWSRNRKPEAEANGISYSESILTDADIITVNLALNPQTEKYFDAERITGIKKGAIVICLSPMELFDFSALLARLKQNDLTFILDHSDEMTEEQLGQLRPLDNCIIYPPIAYLTAEASALKKKIYVDNVKNFLNNQPTNVVNSVK